MVNKLTKRLENGARHREEENNVEHLSIAR